MAILASLHRPAGYGYNKKRKPEQVDVTRIEESAPAPVVAAAPRPRAPGRMPQSTEDQIIATNNMRRGQQEEEDYSRGQQIKRNLSMIHARNRSAGKASPVSREDDMAKVLENTTPKQIAARAPRDRGAEAASTQARAIVPMIAAPQPEMGVTAQAKKTPASRFAPDANGVTPNFGPVLPAAASASPAAAPAAPPAPAAAPAPITAGQPLSVVPPTTAEMQAQARPSLDAIPGDAAAIRAAAPPMSQMIDDGTNEIVQRANLLARSAKAGMTPQQQGAMDEASAIFARGPRAQQQAGDRAAIAAMKPTNYRSPAPTAAPAPGVDPRYDALAAEAERGQTAIDTGRSLEQQQADKELNDQRQFEIGLVGAANPPRPATGSYRPEQGMNRLDVDLQGRYQATLAQLQKVPPMIYDAASGEEIVNPKYQALEDEIQRILDEQQRRSTGGQGTSGDAGAKGEALPMNAGKVDVTKLKDGAVYTNSKGERAKWNAKTGKFESI